MTKKSDQIREPVAIVTGVSRGYGKAVSQALIRAGWVVIGDARDEESLNGAAKDLDAGRRFVVVPGDIGSDLHRQDLIREARSNGHLRLIVNNASTLGPSPLPQLAKFDLAELFRLFRLNTIAPIALIQLALPDLKSNKGAIVNISSDAAVEAYEGWGGYGASKAALEQATRVLVAEEPDVRVYILDPGDMRTEMHQAAFPGEDISDRPEPEVSAPAVVLLSECKLASGRYRAADVLA